jgi:cell division septation protein DedD
MDTSLKQRLIGAAVLVALAVIFLPMLVQGPAPDNGAGDVSLNIPEQPPGAMETREMPLQLPTAPDLAPLPDDPNRVVAVETDSAAQADALVGNEPTPPADAAGETTALTAPPAPIPAPAVTAVPEPASAEPATPSPSPAPSPSVPAPKPAAPVTAATGGYAVNLGAYGNLANAKTLFEQLRAAGLPATSDAVTLSGKPAARLRLGPYARRADAEADRLKALKLRADLPATVVALDGAVAATATTAPAPATANKVGFAVQVGAFRATGDAAKLVESLRKSGFTAFSESVRTDSGTLYRVRVGPEIRRADAEKLRDAVAAKLKLDGIVVPHP